VSASRLADGVYPVLPTTFDASGRLDLDSFRRLVRFVAETGARGMLVLGVMGEAPKLVGAERAAVIDAAVEEAGDLRVVVGATHPSVAGARSLASAAARAGAVAVLIAPPRLDRAADDDAMVDYFAAVAAGSELEIVLQDHPVSSGVTLPVGMIARLASEVGAITAVKLEDPPTPQKVTAVRDRTPEGFRIFGGLGGVFLLEELRRGANGTMTGFAFPELLVEIYRAYATGSERHATETFFRYLPLIRFEFQEAIGVAIRKRIYRLRGVIADDHVRLPSTPLDDVTAGELDELIAFTGLSLAPTAAR
jgi:4-hydroxy-tetrahydrodipicolinate synthase